MKTTDKHIEHNWKWHREHSIPTKDLCMSELKRYLEIRRDALEKHWVDLENRLDNKDEQLFCFPPPNYKYIS
jgi:hypothetical protein